MVLDVEWCAARQRGLYENMKKKLIKICFKIRKMGLKCRRNCWNCVKIVDCGNRRIRCYEI